MINRLLNAKKYALKGAFYIAPTLGAEILGTAAYYLYSSSLYYQESLDEQLQIPRYEDCGIYGGELYCRGWQHGAEILIDQAASQYAYDKALTNVNSLFPYIVTTSFAGSILGGLYGFIIAPENIHELRLGRAVVERLRYEISDGNANEDIEEYPEDFKDPIFLVCMENPQKLNCNHILDLTSLKKITPDAKDCINCPLCRTVVTSYIPELGLKQRIKDYLQKPLPTTSEPFRLFSGDNTHQEFSQNQKPSIKPKMA